MKKIELGQTISILANIGVIAGILFLGVELHQNNEMLDAEARQSRVDRALNGRNFFGNPEVATAIAKTQNGQDLTPAEQVQVRAYVMSYLQLWEANFEEVRRGTLDNSTVLMRQRRALHGGMVNGIPLQPYWTEYRNGSSPEFAEWVEENLGNP
jgi:tRNA-dihydrouridine synthase